MAKAKTKTTAAVREDRGQKVGRRPIETILSLYKSGASLRLSEGEVKLLIDEATKIDEERRMILALTDAVVKPIKEILKGTAKEQGWTEKAGSFGACKISPSTTTITGTVTELDKLLKQERKFNLRDSLVSIKITDAKKFLGEDILFSSGLFRVERDEFGTVSLRKITKD